MTPIQSLTLNFRRLVVDLGLKTTLSGCKVPKEDLPNIAELAVGGESFAGYPEVVKLLESIY